MKKNKEGVLVISSYPQRGTLHSSKLGGVDSFTKNTLTSISKEKLSITVLANIQNDEKERTYEEEGISIKRTWKRNHLTMYLNLLKELILSKKNHSVLLLEFEFGVYGNYFVTGFMPIIMLISSILGYKNILVLHQVVNNLEELSQHLGIKSKGIKLALFSLLIKLFYRILGAMSDIVVVFDQIHKNNLIHLIDRDRIVVIPHGIEPFLIKESGKRKRNKRIVFTLFGFIAWYKGTDWLIQSFKEKSFEKYNLVIAGGESPTQKDNIAYQKYYKSVTDLIAESKNITHTGFVQEEDFKKLFSKTDFFILPYRVLMSSSGPLAKAIKYEKPFLLSDKLENYILTKDFRLEMKNLKLKKSNIFFKSENMEDLLVLIDKIENNSNLYEKLSLLSKNLKKRRHWSKLGKDYEKVIKVAISS